MRTLFKVAVIVPTYNLEKIINRTMDNLVHQEGIDEMEVIVIDDGSSDKTLSIVRGYEGKIKNLTIKSFSTPSGGASRPRNMGIELSNSEYISFLDGDDYYGENALITAYQHMKDADANIGDLKVISENRGKEFLILMILYTMILISLTIDSTELWGHGKYISLI